MKLSLTDKPSDSLTYFPFFSWFQFRWLLEMRPHIRCSAGSISGLDLFRSVHAATVSEFICASFLHLENCLVSLVSLWVEWSWARSSVPSVCIYPIDRPLHCGVSLTFSEHSVIDAGCSVVNLFCGKILAIFIAMCVSRNPMTIS